MSRILIVDDDYEIVALLTEILKHDGHEVESAGEPVEGMQKSRSMKPELIILDYHMPGTTGAHLFESLRRNLSSRETPILFMSGEAAVDDIKNEVTDMTGARFLAKPVHLNVFRDTIKDMLKK